MTNVEKLFSEAFGMPFTGASRNNYPPYNILAVGENAYLLELAVAGIQEEDINIETNRNILTISATPTAVDEDNVYLHKGIATRNFRTSFRLKENIVVEGATLDNGMLTIRLMEVIPEELKPRKIEINPQVKELLNE